MSQPQMTRAEEEAATWFARMRGPDAKRHRDAFDAWRSNAENAIAYRQAEEDWLMVGGIAPAQAAAHPSRSAAGRSAPSPWAMAAMLCLALALGLGWYLHAKSDAPLLAETISTPGTTRLADGTAVLLSDGATLVVAFDDRVREVTLNGGQARFTVAHDAARPFTVLAAGSTTTALGTIFEVDLRGARPRVHLVEGSVEIRGTGGAQALRLEPGESAEVDGAAARRLPAMASPLASTRIDADNLPLGKVIERARRANGPPITLAEPGLASRRLTGTFDLADSAALARKLAAALDLELVATTDALILQPKGKKTGG